MSGICIDKLSHSCGTRQGLQVFADTETGEVNGYCFSCQTFVSDPYGNGAKVNVDKKVKTQEDIEKELVEVSTLKVFDCPARKLRAENLDKFNIRISLSEADGKTQTAMYFPMFVEGKLSGYYVKTLVQPSHTWSIGNVRKAEPFNWQNAKRSGAYRLIITEGKEDAVAVDAIVSRFGDEKFRPAVISLPNGVNSVNSSLSQIAQEAKRLFKEIVICFDNDEAGQKAVKDAMLIFPHAMSVTLPEKDANDCIVKGSMKAAYKALSFNLAAPVNTRLIKTTMDLWRSTATPTRPGELTWFSPSMQKLMRGIRLGDTIYEGAGVKMGKSELLDQQAAHHLMEDNVPVMLISPEAGGTDRIMKGVAGKVVGKTFKDPDVPFDEDEYLRAGKLIGERLIILDSYQHLVWETIRDDIIYAANNEGTKAVFIDPITNLTAGLNSADANTFLNGFARDIAALAKDKGLAVFLFCHLKAPEGNISADSRLKNYRDGKFHDLGNCPHEAGGTIHSNQFAGSRAMMQACHLMLGLEGNKDSNLQESTRNTRWLRILEDRHFGNAASVPLYWNRATTQFKEI